METIATNDKQAKRVQFNIRVSDQELQEWERMAREYGVKNIASLIRASVAMFDRENSKPY